MMPIKIPLLIPSDDDPQGVVTDGDFIFAQNTQRLFKYRSNGQLVVKIPRLKLHQGDIVFVKGRIYAAASGVIQKGPVSISLLSTTQPR